MSIFVLDASISLAWWLDPEAQAFPHAVLESLETNEALAPSVWPLEVGNALLVAERRNKVTRTMTSEIIQRLQELPIIVEQESPHRMFSEIRTLAQRCQLTSYDASYLDLAMQHGIPLATLDAALIRAASECGVELYLV